MKNIVWHQSKINKGDRIKLLNQNPFILWFTGLSASGKSTIANLIDENLFTLGYKTYLLDGDNVRHGLNKDLGFDEKSRIENIRRVGEVSKLFLDAGIIVICSFISPFKSDRQLVRDLFKKGDFLETFIDCSIDTCEKRDPKGMYKKAKLGQIRNFTGISSPYQPPQKPEIHIKNDNLLPLEASKKIMDYLINKNYIKK